MFRAIRSAAAVLSQHGNRKGWCYLYPLPTAKADPIPGRSQLSSRLLSPRDKKGKESRGWQGTPQQQHTTDPRGRKNMQLIITNLKRMQGNGTAWKAVSKRHLENLCQLGQNSKDWIASDLTWISQVEREPFYPFSWKKKKHTSLCKLRQCLQTTSWSQALDEHLREGRSWGKMSPIRREGAGNGDSSQPGAGTRADWRARPPVRRHRLTLSKRLPRHSWPCTPGPRRPVGNATTNEWSCGEGLGVVWSVTDTPRFLLMPPAHLHSRDSDKTAAGWPASRTAQGLAKERTWEPRCPGSNLASSTCLLWRNHPQLQNLYRLGFLETTVTPISRGGCETEELPGKVLKQSLKTSLVVQWLKDSALPMHGAWVQSLVRELRSCMLHRVAKK